jgi:hypothetical protein
VLQCCSRRAEVIALACTAVFAVTGRFTTSDCTPGPECSSGGPNIFSQIGGLHWRTFAESMPTPCDPNNTSLYVPRHAPAIYYTRIPRAVCRRDTVTIPAHRLKFKRTFTWITPNLQHDLHDGSLSQASRWLTGFLGGTHGAVHRRPYTRGHTAVFIRFDRAAIAVVRLRSLRPDTGSPYRRDI